METDLPPQSNFMSLQDHLREFHGPFRAVFVVQRYVSLPAFVLAFALSVFAYLPDMPPDYPALAYANLAVFLIPLLLLIFEMGCLFPFFAPGMTRREKRYFLVIWAGSVVYLGLWSALYVFLIHWTKRFHYDLDAQLRLVQMLWFLAGWTAAFFITGNGISYAVGRGRTWSQLLMVFSFLLILTLFLPIWFISAALYGYIFRKNSGVWKRVLSVVNLLPPDY